MSAARLIPWLVHEIVEYLAGIFLILAPFLFFGDEFGEGLDTAALPLFVGVGVLLVALQLLTHGKASIADLLPVRVHATLDYLVAIFLILSPFLFGLTGEDQPQAALLVPVLLGVVHLAITLLTRFPLAAAEAGEPGAGPADPEASSNASGDAAERPSHPRPEGGASDAGSE